MSDQQQHSSNQNSPNDFKPVTPSTATSSNASSEKVNGNREHENVDGPNNWKPNIIVNIPENENDDAIEVAKKANRLSLTGIIVNCLLFAITLYTFLQTKRAVDISQSTLDHAKYQDSLARISENQSDSLQRLKFLEDRIRDSTSAVENRNQFELDSINNSIIISNAQKALQYQFEAIKENQRQFEKENQPYIQAGNFVVKKFKPNEPIIVHYRVFNMGRSTAKIIHNSMAILWLPAAPSQPFQTLSALSTGDSLIQFINSERTYTGRFTAKTPIDSLTYRMIEQGILKLYFVGEIQYLNQMNQRPLKYSFLMNLKYPADTVYQVLYNDIEGL